MQWGVRLAAVLVTGLWATGAQAQATAAETPGWQRWLELQTATLDMRYRVIETSEGEVANNQLQHRQRFIGAVKLDGQAKYRVQFTAATGESLTSSWDDTGVGTGSLEWDLVPRQMYLVAAPVRGVEIQAGGIGVVRGLSSEITSYDNDAYLVGGRLTLERPSELFFDQVSLTAAYFGDINTPNVFRRFDRMNDHNYTHVLLAKDLGEHVSISADWTQAPQDTTWRQAIRFNTPKGAVVDAVRLELYQRVEPADAKGIALVAEKAVTKRLEVMTGISNVDRINPTPIGDRYGRGKRVFGEASFELRPELRLTAYTTWAFDNDFRVATHRRFDIVIAYNVLRALGLEAGGNGDH